MEVSEFQKQCSSILRRIDQEKSLVRDGQFCIAQIVEEFGELAKEINREKLRGAKANKQELENEFADVFLLLFDLAEYSGVDVEQAVEEKLETVRQRFPFLNEDR